MVVDLNIIQDKEKTGFIAQWMTIKGREALFDEFHYHNVPRGKTEEEMYYIALLTNFTRFNENEERIYFHLHNKNVVDQLNLLIPCDSLITEELKCLLLQKLKNHINVFEFNYKQYIETLFTCIDSHHSYMGGNNHPNNSRPSWDEYFMEFAFLTAKRSSCYRKDRKVGAVIVKDNRVIATGYNGAPAGFETCLKKEYCMREQEHIKSGTQLEHCMAVHAEQNALLQCAKISGVSTEGSTMYITHFPCSLCTKMIIQAGIKRIVYKEGYPDNFSKELLNKTKIITDNL